MNEVQTWRWKFLLTDFVNQPVRLLMLKCCQFLICWKIWSMRYTVNHKQIIDVWKVPCYNSPQVIFQNTHVFFFLVEFMLPLTLQRVHIRTNTLIPNTSPIFLHGPVPSEMLYGSQDSSPFLHTYTCTCTLQLFPMTIWLFSSPVSFTCTPLHTF